MIAKTPDNATQPAACRVRIALFGVTKDIVGQSEISRTLPQPATVAALLDDLKAAYPRLSGLSSLAVAVNNDYADAAYCLRENDEIALIPPVSGG
ncbi:MAG: MoaD/ThiS family protein [Ferruginibacter sp.]|nr:MoaD/ThiS family protein [Cytophagales bacterium]